MIGHLLIRDAATNEVILSRRDVHPTPVRPETDGEDDR